MLFNKLSTRGYSGNILTRFFLKFCGRFPIDIKYDFTDGNTLWETIFTPRHDISCCVYDYEAIQNIIRPCKVILSHSELIDVSTEITADQPFVSNDNSNES